VFLGRANMSPNAGLRRQIIIPVHDRIRSHFANHSNVNQAAEKVRNESEDSRWRFLCKGWLTVADCPAYRRVSVFTEGDVLDGTTWATGFEGALFAQSAR
jgi:hypothetical protein